MAVEFPRAALFFHHHRAFRDRLQEGAAVRLREDARIENYHDPRVALGADQATDALPQFQDRLGQRVFRKRVASAFLNRLEPRFDQRMIRHGKRQARDDDVGERLPGDIDAAPETVGAEEDVAPLFLELLHEPVPRDALPLDEKVPPLALEELLHPRGKRLHRPVGGEKDESAPLAHLHVLADPFGERLFVAGVARVGHLAGNVELHLPGVVKRAADLLGLGVFRADPPPEVAEIAPADRERRARHHARAVFAEKKRP